MKQSPRKQQTYDASIGLPLSGGRKEFLCTKR